MEIEFREGISEVIATTRNDQPNAAPMGIINRDFLYTLVYRDSHTFLNVKKNRELVANFVLDPLLYVQTAFDDLDPSFFRSDEAAPVLEEAYAWVEFKCLILEKPTQKSALVKLLPVRSVVLQRPIVSINRAFYAVLEATILATRYRTLKDPKYLERVAHYESIVKKCGGRQELEAFQLLKEHLA
ncbi:MAG: DUF447 domain-containing protein [Halobacteriota archaeon]